jgi:RimJ/RimL family protein N-acetyltransferase
MVEGSIDQFTTARLSAQRITLPHFPEIHRLHSDPLVMKTLSADGNVMSEEATRKHLQRCSNHWDQHGFGLWVFRARADGQFIGRGGLMTYQIDGEDVVGLAYAVMSGHWNQGFATEMAEASLRFGFERLGLSEIDSWTLPINVASQRVMAKLGFRYEKDIEFAGLPHRFYRLVKDDRTAYHEPTISRSQTGDE